jgi:hypothetical protein
MTNPTTPFSWQMPTSSDLVTDLPADFEVFGQAVATSMADLLGGTSGQILAKASNTDMDFTWVTNDVGDITGITATSPLTGGGTSGAVTVGIQSASTSQSGAVQLSDSTSTTSSVLAATSTAVKAAFDKASTAATTSVAGIVQLSDSTSTTSSVLASTPTATKSAYDLANSAYAPAFTNNFYAGKNKIINGDFGIWQRGTSITASSVYTADRWFASQGNGSCSVFQQTFTPGAAPVAGYEGQFFARYAGGNSTSGVPVFQQRIEDVRTLAGQTATVSFYFRNSATGNPSSVTLIQNFGSGGSADVTTTVVSSPTYTGSWVRYSYTISVPSVSGKTIGTSSYLALSFNFPLSQTWTVDIWGVQVEAGSVATPFQTATGTIQGELAACQRYYYRNSGGQILSNIASGAGNSATIAVIFLQMPVVMRTIPTSLDYSTLSIIDNVSTSVAVTSLVFNTNQGSNNTYGLVATVAAGLTAYRPYFLVGTSTTASYVGLNAEL